jgi:group II intron reverse transcriptase/maturase
MPLPYLRITIPKKNNERRKLGLLSIKDKIVQQALKSLIEYRFEKIFVKNSYGYRPSKGHTKAVRYALHCFKNKLFQCVLRLDIDNYFDNVDHEILNKRLCALIPDAEIDRLIMLSMKMGCVDNHSRWENVTKGLPQGGVLSPLLANLYLHSFDQFVLSKDVEYVRYADDF